MHMWPHLSFFLYDTDFLQFDAADYIDDIFYMHGFGKKYNDEELEWKKGK